jgi:hypothetical protein
MTVAFFAMPVSRGNSDCRIMGIDDTTLVDTMHSMTTPNSPGSAALHASPRARGTLSQLTSIVALAALLGAGLSRCAGVHRRRHAAMPQAMPEKLQVWEDEGGQNQMPDAPK